MALLRHARGTSGRSLWAELSSQPRRKQTSSQLCQGRCCQRETAALGLRGRVRTHFTGDVPTKQRGSRAFLSCSRACSPGPARTATSVLPTPFGEGAETSVEPSAGGGFPLSSVFHEAPHPPSHLRGVKCEQPLSAGGANYMGRSLQSLTGPLGGVAPGSLGAVSRGSLHWPHVERPVIRAAFLPPAGSVGLHLAQQPHVAARAPQRMEKV